ncbi:MAG: phage tail protein [Oscillospiraceae bacterium]|nr:phage tail protein [Oscillospiraceae bacterium]
MYQITIDNGGERQILHADDPNSTQRIAAGKFKEYVGLIPSVAITVTPQNACYNMLHDRNTLTELKNTETGEIEFEGYLLKSPESMTSKGTLQKKLTFEGFLGYLNDSVQMYRHFENASPTEFITAVLDYHNATTEESKHIYVGMINAGQGGSKTTAYRSTLGELKENLVSRFGGELRVRRGPDGRLYLDYLTAANNGGTSDVIVNLGHNLRSLSIESDTANIITRLIPLGAQLDDITPAKNKEQSAERLTIIGAVDPDDGHTYAVPYIDDPAAIARYGVIVGTVEFDDITVKENLVARGKSYLTENNRVKKHYAASVLDISGKGVIRCGDTYRFRNPLMGIDENLRLLGRTVDILKPYTPDVEIGDKTAKITSMTAKTQHMIDYELPNQLSQTVQTAQRIATQMIEAATTGYVVIRPNEILIMDTDDIETATSVWRMNSGGIGYSSTGYHGSFGTAITMDGHIIGSFIAAGSIYADRIRGGTLLMGGTDNVNGVIEVADASGNIVCRLDQNGADIFGQVLTRDAAGYWVQLIGGQLIGGFGNDKYVTIDASADIYSPDIGRHDKGLNVEADGINFTCNTFGINGGRGTGGTLYCIGGSPAHVVTDVSLDADGQLDVQYANIAEAYFSNGILVGGG